MIGSTFRVAVILVGLIGSMTSAALALGRAQPPHPALASFNEGCQDRPQPCWRGIVPGVTTGAEARRLVQTIGGEWLPEASSSFTGYFRTPELPFVCSVVLRVIDNTVTWVGVYYCNRTHLTIGDIAARLGMPEIISPGTVHSLGYGGEREYLRGGKTLHDRATVINLVAD